LKKSVKILSFTGIVFFMAACLFYYLYSSLSQKTSVTMNRLVLVEKKVGDLTKEKELLMARLVILGKEPVMENQTENKNGQSVAAIEEKKPLVSKNQEIKPIPLEPEEDEIADFSKNKEQQDFIETEIKTPDEIAEAVTKSDASDSIKKTISIEKFTVTKDGRNGDLLVRFDIRNISTAPGDVSGRIFTVLKPDNNMEDQWLVVPTAALKNGIPSEHRKGQYFSIAHFKPVKFRIKNEADPDFFKKASIFIFNTKGDLIFESLIDITEAE
ncbi:MAG: hypothetical protein KKE44_16350, partial [Proteobacteria bacterium]|nr:hypothetical protein [Pseudomonadota bacterium]MBU1584301.1 hypothetical protein [Pseudomonadota bacterium]